MTELVAATVPNVDLGKGSERYYGRVPDVHE
ncbi:hypothetical protein ALC60_04736 [Trachymyrmex zeteki]|uniref:Uncharacterized protein n=1 Tax=Mycetomoellerius zeteki TaxID=64791 RepID=A0A151X7M0_9HYME|nr:hypothetical protein ALC60_04736 [Trachymyrmex zeteki]